MLVLVAAALFGGGVLVGWRAALQSDPGRVPDTVTVAAAGTVGGGGGAVVPDVRGLARVDALQALADAGVPPAAIDVVSAPSALATDVVLRQDPPGGAPFDGTVLVDVAAPGTVPSDAVGRPLADLRTVLEDLGAQVRVTYDYAATAPSGSVLSITPAPGAALAPEIQVVAAADPGSVYVSELVAVNGGGNSGEVAIGGTTYTHGLRISSTADYLLNRGVHRASGVVGLPDDGDADAAATLVVTADGKEVLRRALGYGRSTPVDLTLDGVLRLSITVERPVSGNGGTAAFGDLLFSGRPDVIDKLAHR